MTAREIDEQAIDDALAAGLAEPLYAGAVVGVSRGGLRLFTRAVGLRDREAGLVCTTGTVFDLASVTKMVATTTVVMRLVATGAVGLDTPVRTWLPGVDPRITPRLLLTHRAGLWEWQPLYRQSRAAATTVDLVAGLPLRYAPDTERHYSDFSFILLGALAEKAGGASLAGLFAREVAGPCGMGSSGFVPAGSGWPQGWAEPAATGLGDEIEQQMIASGKPYPVWLDGEFDAWRSHRLRGEVADGNAWAAMGGVSGHAGLFSTLDDLLAYGEHLAGVREPLIPDAVVREFARPGPDAGQALGFRLTSVREGGPAIWHPGFTGPRVLVQPETGTVIVALANRLDVPGTPRHGYPPLLDGWFDRIVDAVLGPGV